MVDAQRSIIDMCKRAKGRSQAIWHGLETAAEPQGFREDAASARYGHAAELCPSGVEDLGASDPCVVIPENAQRLSGT